CKHTFPVRSPSPSHHPFLFFSLIPPPPTSTLFPYTTLFRSPISPLARQLPLSPQVCHGAFSSTMTSEKPSPSVSGYQELLKVNSDRKSTRLNSSHLGISYAVFCLKKKKKNQQIKI